MLANLSTLPPSPEHTIPQHAPLHVPLRPQLHAQGVAALDDGGGYSQTLIDGAASGVFDRTRLLAEPPLTRETSGFAFGFDEECILPDDPPIAGMPVQPSLDARATSPRAGRPQPSVRRNSPSARQPNSPPAPAASPVATATLARKRGEDARARSLPKKVEVRLSGYNRAVTIP